MAANYNVKNHLDVKTPMRDGVDLSADIYLPEADGSFPTILIRTPYNNNRDELVEKGRALANSGYACVIQDFRGRHNSDGVKVPFGGLDHDGFDTHEWIGQQVWSDGKIGTSGASYLGIAQWLSAPERSKFLTCMVPRVAPCDFVDDALAPGGAFQLTWLMIVALEAAVSGRVEKSTMGHHWTKAFRLLPLANFDELMGFKLPYWKAWIEQPLDSA